MVVNVRESALLMSESCLETWMHPQKMSLIWENILTLSCELDIYHKDVQRLSDMCFSSYASNGLLSVPADPGIISLQI